MWAAVVFRHYVTAWQVRPTELCPYGDKHYIQSTILQAARDAGVDLRQVGSRAYSTNTLESDGYLHHCLASVIQVTG